MIITLDEMTENLVKANLQVDVSSDPCWYLIYKQDTSELLAKVHKYQQHVVILYHKISRQLLVGVIIHFADTPLNKRLADMSVDIPLDLITVSSLAKLQIKDIFRTREIELTMPQYRSLLQLQNYIQMHGLKKIGDNK